MSTEPVTSETSTSQNIVKADRGPPPSSDLSDLTTVPSSPPWAAFEQMARSKGDLPSGIAMPPPSTKRDTSAKGTATSRKRAHEDAEDEGYEADESQNVRAAPAQLSTRGKKRGNSNDSSVTSLRDSHAEDLAEQPHTVETPSQQVPPSGQGANVAQTQQGKSSEVQGTAESALADPHNGEGEEDNASEHGSETSDQSSDLVPEEQLEYFDWENLTRRYHDKMQELGHQEEAIMFEFNKLMDYFGVWAMVGGTKDVNRSFKRLKTQSALVQNEERQLEQKRQHYIQVVNAFKTVGVLLDKPNWHQNIVPNRRRLSGMRLSLEKNNSAQTQYKKDPSAPVIGLEEWPISTVNDVDMARYHVPDFHASRCVIL
ncbi:hypothetical protein Slin15195_G077040 [Septoria linicola]|uniref:Uncharacterized protein n=1 Tax=Septoria linicola TaxID=215465 RepID=A0A9Q9AXN6_9PEZI|nr:hypothetical protein Slin14017_G038210 [Septoria linicola]USW54385.1 hypothetical protein Slin15195_G077040 [Septoria linicola]